jgi:hypothetical protein
MKKGYIWLAPLAVLILFIFIYMQSRVEIESKIQAEKERKRQAIIAQNEETKRKNDLAIIERKRITDEKNLKDAEEKARKDAEAKHLDEIDYARDFAKRETTRYNNVVKELTEAFNTEKAAQKAAEKAIADMRDEKKFIVEYVAKAQANEKALKELLQKLAKLDAERAEAAKLAAKG